jgi:hypothetical protein
MKTQLQDTEPGAPRIANPAVQIITLAVRRPILLVASAALIIGVGFYLNWPALVALGLAPLILTFAPCALMCALGICAISGSKNRAAGKSSTQDDQE